MRILRTACLCAALSAIGLAWGQTDSKPETKFENDPKARALYDGMVAAMRKADSLTWTSEYTWFYGGDPVGASTYQIWLKKPNFARLEARPKGQDKASGVMVLDGSRIWVFWPNGKVQMPFENKGKRAAEYKNYRMRYFMRQEAPLARHSIGHVTDNLGSGMGMPIIDPSTFHGYTDSLQPYVDGVRFVEDQTIGGETCKGIEVSFMKYQRSWKLWLSPTDTLPRKLEQVVRVNKDIVMNETWTDVKVNGALDSKLFAWAPPKDWKQWRLPSIEEGLLAKGTVAPDFELTDIAGNKVKLSSLRGKIVWLNKWRCG